MILLLRRLALFFAMIAGVVSAQLPEYAQQYRQRLGGALDELNAYVERFDNDAKQNGLTEAEAITRLKANQDNLVQNQGQHAKDIVARRDQLAKQLQAFSEDGQIRRIFDLTQADPTIAWRAYQAFEPGVPITTEGVVSAIVGFILGGLLIRLLGWPFERWHKRRRERAMLPTRAFPA